MTKVDKRCTDTDVRWKVIPQMCATVAETMGMFLQENSRLDSLI